jgi:hypothetical protein
LADNPIRAHVDDPVANGTKKAARRLRDAPPVET